ncbi:MAG: hypothetical protein HC880_00595 [Bacteroidia bacterium]|nr:hypothetical protein [Bacteroidia bacterium]
MHQNLQEITINARVSLSVVTSTRTLFIIKHKRSLSIEWSSQKGVEVQNESSIAYRESKGKDIHHWCIYSFLSILNWLHTKSIKGDDFYDKYLKKQVPDYLGYYSPVTQPQESNTFGTCFIH